MKKIIDIVPYVSSVVNNVLDPTSEFDRDNSFSTGVDCTEKVSKIIHDSIVDLKIHVEIIVQTLNQNNEIQSFFEFDFVIILAKFYNLVFSQVVMLKCLFTAFYPGIVFGHNLC